MKFIITRKDFIGGLSNFADTYKINNKRFVGDIVSYEDFKNFNDIEKAFKSYKIIKEHEIFHDEYVNKVLDSFRSYEGDHTVLVKIKGKVKHIGKTWDSILTIECSKEEYSKLDLHDIGVKNTLAVLEREGVTEDSVLEFESIKEMLKKYEIVNSYNYISKHMYKKYNMISCEPHGKAVLIDPNTIPLTEEEIKDLEAGGHLDDFRKIEYCGIQVMIEEIKELEENGRLDNIKKSKLIKNLGLEESIKNLAIDDSEKSKMIAKLGLEELKEK